MRATMRRWSARLLVLTVAVLFLSAVGLPVTVRAAETETVRVGLFPLGNFQNFNENGVPYGYNIDYLNNISKYTHWDYEFIRCDNWVEATTLLEKGEIDLLAPAQKTEDLQNRFDYAVYSMGTEFAAIYTSDTRDDLLFEDFGTMAGLKYGGAQNSTFTYKFLAEYCAKAGFNPQLTYYSNTSELFSALENKKVDAIITNIMFAGEGIKLLGRFSPLPVYYITQKDSPLLEELDDALTTIRLQDPSLEAELMAQYFPVFNSTQFTYEELEYIKKSPEIVIAYEADYGPLSFMNQDSEEFEGIIKDILDLVEAYTGFTFCYVPMTERQDKDSQEIMALAGVDSALGGNAYSLISLSAPYLETERVIIVNDAAQFDKDACLTLAVDTRHVDPVNVVGEAFPNFNVLECNSIEECFMAVKEGKADALIQNRYVVEPWLSKPVYSHMSVIPVQSMPESLCMAVTEKFSVKAEGTGWDPVLFLEIIDKAIKRIPAKDINGIIIHNTMQNRYQVTLGDVLYQFRYTLLVILLLLGICMGLILYARAVEANKNCELSEKNKQLSEAIALAEHANTSKSRFLSRMSHEIRTPMNAVVGLTAIAKTHKKDPDAVEGYLDKIDKSSKILLSIINDVLDMSAIESNKLKIANIQFDVKTVLIGISTIYYPQCRQKGIRFMMATDIREEILVGDSLRLNQILMNLVSNAYKFTETGGEVRITVKETTRREDKVFLRIVVSDTGVGMSEEMTARLFNPFEQESSETAGKYGGSGLGLSIAKNLVEMMHGAISVKSQKGKGTSFIVDLPFETTGQEITADRKLKDLRALVVDDDENAREYTSIILDRIGVSYDTAVSGEEAVDKLRASYDKKEGYDICFVDWKMPQMDGVELTKKIRSLYSSDVVIIIVSAFDLSEVTDEARLAGADLFIPKPMFQSTIFDLLMNLSGGKYAKRTADESSYDFTGHKVLLAEDHPMNREIAVELLHLVHMEVDCAQNGREAMELFTQSEQGTYDVILMDIQMPEMDGHEAARKIRACGHPQAGSIPIYAMTANAFTEDVSAAISAGMNGHIAKPIDTNLLYETLKKCIDSKNIPTASDRKDGEEE